MKTFILKTKDVETKARRGVLKTHHGEIQTPFFMSVGTNATVKSLTNEDLEGMGAQIVLSNTYHLYLRPGLELIKNTGGLHQFMGWDKPILTDSGGYQIFSLAKFRKLTDKGVEFRSHIDGSLHFFTPEDIVDVQGILRSDIMMPLDECAPYPCDEKQAKEAVKRTGLWARRSREHFLKSPYHERQSLFGIVQGSHYESLRRMSAEEIVGIGFDGYAIGGVSVGEPIDLMFEAISHVIPFLPTDKPRYVMGIGMPDQIVRAVGEGVDMFDTCVPTRYGRYGSAFTRQGRIIVRNLEFAKDMRPLDETCDCFVCKRYSRSYIRHLFTIEELTGLRMTSYHNLYFYIKLMAQIRAAIEANKFLEFQKEFLSCYGSTL